MKSFESYCLTDRHTESTEITDFSTYIPYGCHSHFVFPAWHDGTRQWSCDQEVSR